MDVIDPFVQYRLTRVINASGTMTALGASRARDDSDRGNRRDPAVFCQDRSAAGAGKQTIAEATGAGAGCVTACAAAGMALPWLRS